MRHRWLTGMVLVLTVAACADRADEAEARIRTAQAAHPDDPVAAAEAGNAEARRGFAELAADDDDPRQLAAIAFLAYYAKTTEAMPAACAEAGAPIDRFAARFAERYADTHAVAAAYPGARETVERYGSTLGQSARDDLARLAQAMETDIAGACAQLQEGAEFFAEGADFAKGNPQAQQLLDELKH